MAQLSTIIGSILRDIVAAQQKADMYAASLTELYKNNPRMKYIPIPGVTLGEIEFELHYAIGKPAGRTLWRKRPEQQEVDMTIAASKLAKLPERCVDTIRFKVNLCDLLPGPDNDENETDYEN